MERYYHVDGELRPADEATVNVRDRGFLYGDAAFETLRTYGRSVFEWSMHLERLRSTARTLGMGAAVPTDEDLRTRVRETLSANDLTDAYVRLSVTRGVQPGKLTPDPDVDPTVVVIVDGLPRGGTEGPPVWDDRAVVRTVETRRVPDEAVPATTKTHNYLNGILARLELRRSGADPSGTDPTADEALLRDGEGYLAEGTTSNVFFVADGVLRTPSTDGSLLPGVTRSVVLDLARDSAIPVETGRYTVRDLQSADEAFLTNTTWEIRPIATVDGVEFSEGTTSRRLRDRFDELVEERHY
ncbi:aminotransferase class IV [Halococcus hamelinensis]|uniref:Aminotransferase class IV n=1 Tax=Halococcus hamelinensis 100A6 TaxID=1132509 RepID=M0LX90_9EURY|nr:aminotransferase class IV [Halococcus hamelinensis]EMA38056.1 aminotransferase class IV [Halococcus hamelinensis 100A6]